MRGWKTTNRKLVIVSAGGKISIFILPMIAQNVSLHQPTLLQHDSGTEFPLWGPVINLNAQSNAG